MPRLRIIHARQKLSVMEIAFQNDPRMAAIESGKPQFILKRIEQFATVARSLVTEWQKLNP